MRVTSEEFIRIYLEGMKKAKPMQWVADKCGTNAANVSQRSNYMRSKGIKIPLWNNTRFSQSMDVDKLNSLIQEVTKNNR